MKRIEITNNLPKTAKQIAQAAGCEVLSSLNTPTQIQINADKVTDEQLRTTLTNLGVSTYEVIDNGRRTQASISLTPKLVIKMAANQVTVKRAVAATAATSAAAATYHFWPHIVGLFQ